MSGKRQITAADEPFMLIRTSMSDVRGGAVIATHTHDWHQLIYVRSGLMSVATAAGSWVAPPTWAVWVPACVGHGIRFVGDSALRTVYLKVAWRTDFPRDCRTLAVSPLLRELIVRATAIGMLDGRDPTESAIASLIVAELGQPGPPPFRLPEPTSPVAVEAARLMAGDAAGALSTPALARAVGIGIRTLERRFRAETGMTLGRWRQQQLLLRGLERVASGASVKEAAKTAGYGSPSAFIAAFRKAFGTTPARHF
jgi:AraC-like DNA-binding protein